MKITIEDISYNEIEKIYKQIIKVEPHKTYYNNLTITYVKSLILKLNDNTRYDLYINGSHVYRMLNREELICRIMKIAGNKYGEITIGILDNTDISLNFIE